MKIARRFGLTACLCSLFLLISSQVRSSSLAQTASGEGQAKFSRAEWIARYSRQVRFSGGVMPSIAAPALPGAEVESPTKNTAPQSRATEAESGAAEAESGATAPVRVSSDLLPTDSAAQPATHAEPYLDANPADANNLLGGWQENRFAGGGARASRQAGCWPDTSQYNPNRRPVGKSLRSMGGIWP